MTDAMVASLPLSSSCPTHLPTKQPLNIYVTNEQSTAARFIQAFLAQGFARVSYLEVSKVSAEPPVVTRERLGAPSHVGIGSE